MIRLEVTIYARFPLSLRNVEDLLFERGIDISHETMRHCWNRFGPPFVGDIRWQRVSRMRASGSGGGTEKALRRHGRPETIATDGLRFCGAAMKEPRCADRQKVGRWANNRVENSHLPFRRRERAMLRFRQTKSQQEFAGVHANVRNHFNHERHLVDRQSYKQPRSAARAEWRSLAS